MLLPQEDVEGVIKPLHVLARVPKTACRGSVNNSSQTQHNLDTVVSCDFVIGHTLEVYQS